MKATLAQWLKLRDACGKLEAAQREFESIALEIAMEHSGDTRELFLAIASGAKDVDTYLLTPQSEWMGGPTRGPGSERTKTYLREPHAAGTRPRHFTIGEIHQAQKSGLLSGDYSGPDA